MRVFKFGGASVKDAEGVKNIVKILQKTGYKDTLVILSAMGKTTNALEKVVEAYFNDQPSLTAALQPVITYHNTIVSALFADVEHPVYAKVKQWFEAIKEFLHHNQSTHYAFVYDQVVSYGELISTTIVSEYLSEAGLPNTWLDVRDSIKTDSTYREGQVDWKRTQREVTARVNMAHLNITQGFLGSDKTNFTTTLGREGSDYTAAIFAYCLDATSVTIWKDVPGVLNADPRYFQQTQLLHQISYEEAIELTFYGASVIHPKTLQPLQRKGIPLHVKSFIQPENKGTTVNREEGIVPKIPCFIVKKDQVLLQISSLDFSFMVENNISEIFKLLHNHRLKVDLIQNSAISFSVCLDNKFKGLQPLLKALKQNFRVLCHEKVSLCTIRHFNEAALTSLQNGKTVLVEQHDKQTVQLVVK